MNDWTKNCSTCKYASCPAPEACYCAMEREAAEETRHTMRMLTFVLLYSLATAAIVIISLVMR